MSLSCFTILVVDDEPRVRLLLEALLNKAGFAVLKAENGLEALSIVKTKAPDLVILDVLMPYIDGFETLREIRLLSAVPVIFLSAHGSDFDKIRGLRLGADDYLGKPFNPEELIARIQAIRRRLEPTPQTLASGEFSRGNVRLDFNRRRALIDGAEVHFSHTEWRLLNKLVQNIGRFLTQEEILTDVWGPEYKSDVSLLHVLISRVRRKLGEDRLHPRIIRTIQKTGYMVPLEQVVETESLSGI